MRTINIYLRMSEHTTTEVTAQNRTKSQRSYIIRNQPVTLRIGIFRHEAAVAIMSKAELEAEGWKAWLLNISKNHTLSYPVYIQPDYDFYDNPITVSEGGIISVVLNTTDTEESAKAIKGMPGDMWEAELTGFAEEDTALETPLAILQWPIGYINRVADENADAPGLLESTYYTKEQVNELLRQIAPEGTWGHIIGDITDQEDLIALLEEKANKATTLAGYGITDAYTKTEIDSKVASVYRYKGSVNAYSDLPTENRQVGDVYNVVTADATHDIKAGDNVAWNGENWDVLAGEIDLSGYIQKAEKGEPNGVPTLDENGKVPMSQMLVLQLDSPPTTSTVGSVGQLAVWHDSETNKDHLYHLCFVSEGESATLYHWEECVLVSQGNVAGGYPILGANGKLSATLLDLNVNVGTQVYNGTQLGLAVASNSLIDQRYNTIRVITLSNLEYAVRSVLPNVTEIPAATSDYSLVDSSATTNNHSHVYSHSPSAVPTYRLPQVTNTTIAHYIELTVDFTNVQTYSFLDYQGEPIVPLFTPAIAGGDVYTFKCEYSNIKAAWLIYPQKQGAVADDFVMRGEVGAANGVAGLNENAKVPSGQLPLASMEHYGAVMLGPSGLGLGSIELRKSSTYPNGIIVVHPASNNHINLRYPLPSGAIMPSNLNLAVTAAMTDANHITLNDAEKATAQEVFGVGGPITAIPAATTAYTLAEGIFTHAPTSAPTYTLPNITDDIRTHEVVLIIDFSSVQTFSFLVDGGGDVTFQSYANPTMGDVWAFRCWWYGGKWRIAPTKIKNCVTRQLANGSLSITDAVGGNALALKMVATRSVVVNQLVQTTDFASGVSRGVTFTNNGDGTVTANGTNDGVDSSLNQLRYQAVVGHTYLWYGCPSGGNVSTYSIRCENNFHYDTGNGGVVTPSIDTLTLRIRISQGDTTTYTNLVFKPQLVDLTQYFNGDSSLIDSITSWDDLVAYDPCFASYVPYNTGTVKGVQPTVKVNHATDVACPVELFGVSDTVGDSFDGVSGVVTRKVGVVDLGTLAWTTNYPVDSTYPYSRHSTRVPGAKPENNWAFIISNKYVPGGRTINNTMNTTLVGNDPWISVYDSDLAGMTPAQVKTAMSGVYLYYELATPTTSQSTPTQITLQAGSNTAMQTDGGRLAPIDITYESDEL